MTRFILLFALLAVGYDAVVHQGSYSRGAVNEVQRLINGASGSTATAPSDPGPSRL